MFGWVSSLSRHSLDSLCALARNIAPASKVLWCDSEHEADLVCKEFKVALSEVFNSFPDLRIDWCFSCQN
jgi:hypothetical protein